MPMKYFSPEEFRRNGVSWFEHCHLDLLQMLDDFRHCLGLPLVISPNDYAVGRQLGKSGSMHNIDRWQTVRAVDVLLPREMQDAVAAIEAERLARHVGFTGIGLYPDWEPRAGMHLDNRPGKVVRWGGIKIAGRQVYTTFEKAVVRMGDEE